MHEREAAHHSCRNHQLLLMMVSVVCLLLASTPAVRADIVAPELSYSIVARDSVEIRLPLLTGLDGEVLQGRVNSSTLKYGTITKVVGWTYKYSTTYELVDPAGCTDIASYTLSDAAGFSTSASIVIQIAANSDPSTWGAAADTAVNKPAAFDISLVSYDGDGDVITLSKVEKPLYGQITVNGTIISYKPVLALVDSQTGAQDAFSYSITDGRGGTATGILQVNIAANRPPEVVSPISASVKKNRTVVIDLQLGNVTDGSYPIYDLDADYLSASLNLPGASRLGSIKDLGHGVFTYYAFPGVSDIDETEVFTFTLNDNRGGSATGQIQINVGFNLSPIVRSSTQQVVTLSTAPVIVAPLVDVSDPDSDQNEENLILLNISQPQHGVLEILSCCNSLSANADAKYWYYGPYNRQVADYRYTPFGNITSHVVENITYSASDQQGGLTLYGVAVPGFVAKTDDFYYSSEISRCGGMVTWTNCFNGQTGTDSETGAKGQGLTMWQNLGTVPCSAECEVATKQYTLLNSGLAAPGTPAMLDLTQLPDFTSKDVASLIKDGYQVFGLAVTTGPPTAPDGFPAVPTAASKAAAAPDSVTDGPAESSSAAAANASW
eukprot:gene8128-8322_t